MPTFKTPHLRKHPQEGIALIAALIILTAMTALGFSSLRNTTVQSAIANNTQFLMYARNIASAEINGQLGLINTNLPTDNDAIIQTLLDTGVGQEINIADNDADTTDVGALQTAHSAYQQSVTMTLSCRSCPAPIGGFSYGGSGVAALVATVQSSATLSNTQARSTQTQGFWYLIPSN